MEPIINPELPYVGEVSLSPGKMVKVQGQVPPESTRFAINYQLGPGLNPRDDIALHVSPRFNEGFITRNHIQSMTWGPEENSGPMWIERSAPFEIIILCEYQCFKIAVNGRHFTEFGHRFPYSKVTHLVIDGEVEISSIFYETIPIPKPVGPIPDPPINVGPPAPGGLYPTLNPQGPPSDPGAPGGPPSFEDDFRSNPQDYGYRPKSQKSEEDDLFGGFGDKAALAVGGLVAAGGLAAAMHAYNKNKQKHVNEGDHERSQATTNESGLGGLGALGAALASSLVSNSHAQQGYPPPDAKSDVIGSILGALGGGGASHNQQSLSDPLGGALGSILGGLGGGSHSNHNQQSPPDPLGGTLGSILGGVLGGGGHHQQPQYQPSGGYGGYPQNQNSQAGSSGSDLLSGLGGALFKSALDGLSKHSHKPRYGNDEPSGGHYSAPQPTAHYDGRHDGDYNSPPSRPPPQAPSPPASGGGKLTAEEISKGLGLDD
ncbi:protein pygopus-like [Phymastichus coffea]|uniref:protein pygopus-like n=1 Tax=Phymastichus coffea TaxID=108790 RepID=UPI00273CAAD9|nr:protein pygopus-like [Phymastichus coffea]XP_058809901.1 protein pygopus-like [Phymastichus coffea]